MKVVERGRLATERLSPSTASMAHQPIPAGLGGLLGVGPPALVTGRFSSTPLGSAQPAATGAAGLQQPPAEGALQGAFAPMEQYSFYYKVRTLSSARGQPSPPPRPLAGSSTARLGRATTRPKHRLRCRTWSRFSSLTSLSSPPAVTR